MDFLNFFQPITGLWMKCPWLDSRKVYFVFLMLDLVAMFSWLKHEKSLKTRRLSVTAWRGCFTKPKSAHRNEEIPESNTHGDLIPISNSPHTNGLDILQSQDFILIFFAFSNSTFPKKIPFHNYVTGATVILLESKLVVPHAWVDFAIQEALQGAE